MSNLITLENKLDSLHRLIAEQVLPDLAVIKFKQEDGSKRLDNLDDPDKGRVTRVEKTQEKIINRTVGAFAVLSVAWTLVGGLMLGERPHSLPHLATAQPVLPGKEFASFVTPVPEFVTGNP